MSGCGRRPAWTCRRPSSAQRCSVGNTLPGLSRPSASNAHLRRCCMGEIVGAEHLAHQVALLDADAVLAGEHAADLDAQPQDLGAERLGPLELARRVGVVEDQRVQIAVAGMEHVGDAQARSARTSRRCGSAPPAGARAGWCRPCSSSRARSGRPPETPPCARPRSAAALPPPLARGWRRRPAPRDLLDAPGERPSTSASGPSTSTISSASTSSG